MAVPSRPFSPSFIPSLVPERKPGQDSPGTPPPYVAFWDPDPGEAARLRGALETVAVVVVCPTLEELAAHCEARPPAVVLLPLAGTERVGTVSGEVLAFLRRFRQRVAALVYGDTARLSIAVYSQPLAAGARQVLNVQAAGYLDDLRGKVDRLVEDAVAHQRDEEQLTEVFAKYGIVAGSLSFREVFRRTLKASQFSDLPVLILGETGTGKQRIAEVIHKLDSVRSDKPFVTVNCGDIDRTLAGSQLFGHTRGAFSGAQGERLGLFRSAQGGTLLLDEVGELDLELQVRLLRVLQEYRLLPVGEDYEQPIDVRVLAATNRPLEKLVAEGKFREDLYQRLNVFRITIPPLRERPEDVGPQLEYFLRIYQGEREGRVTEVSPQVEEALQALPWEGNTRQLENLVREVLAHRERPGGVLVLHDLPQWVFERLAQGAERPEEASEKAAEVLPPSLFPPFSPRATEWAALGAQSPEAAEAALVEHLTAQACASNLSWAEALEAYERLLLERVLKKNGGNRTRAAAQLRLTPRTIFTKIKKYELD